MCNICWCSCDEILRIFNLNDLEMFFLLLFSSFVLVFVRILLAYLSVFEKEGTGKEACCHFVKVY
jgi:hypothetical protein